MRNNFKKILFFLFVLVVAGILPQDTFAQGCDEETAAYENASEVEKIDKNQELQACLRNEASRLGSQAKTLSGQIAQFDAQIYLSQLKIEETEDRIRLLGGRIDQLEGSLATLGKAFNSRVSETYKMTRLGDSVIFLLTSPDLSTAVNRYFYLQRIQEADRDLLTRLQEAQVSYASEKVDQEDLQKELQVEKAALDSQKAAKADLLAVTRNDEKRYLQLLAQVQAEYEAIVAITAGKGVETEVGPVSEGVRIANVIQGSSCNSSGTHLHFIVRRPGGITDNPFSHLKGGVSYVNNSGGDPFNPSGNWEWPINPTISFNQGYGSTWAIQNTWVGSIYSFHNGIDINSGSSEVKAVRSGTLYRGSYNVGCTLRYVRVAHDDSDLDTLYLHVNY